MNIRVLFMNIRVLFMNIRVGAAGNKNSIRVIKG